MSSVIKEIRVENLLRVLEDYDSLDDFAADINLGPAVAGQINIGPFSDRMARLIESKLGLYEGYLDIRHHESSKESAELLDEVKLAYKSEKLTPQEQKVVDKFREIDRSKQNLLIDMLAAMGAS